jgi:hypothetical protein
MQSSLIRPSRRPLAWLTLCAIAAPSSTAWAEPARARDPIAALVGALTNDEEIVASREPESTAAIPPIAFTLGAAKGPLAAVSLPRLPALSTVADATAAPPTAPAPVDDGSGLRTAGYVAGGVGLVGLALFAIAGLGAKNAYDKLDADCGSDGCTDEAHRSDIEGGRMLQTAANIGLATGLTGLGVGATLMVLGSRSPVEKREPSASVSANGGMITYGGHF